jgi:hypothetical protein
MNLKRAMMTLGVDPRVEEWGVLLHHSGSLTTERRLELAGVRGNGVPMGIQQQLEVLPLQDAFDDLPYVRPADAYPELPLHRLSGLHLKDQVVSLTY